MSKTIIITMGHPAHFHLFRHVIVDLREQGHRIHIVITNKDILRNLLDEYGLSYTVLAEGKNGKSLPAKAAKLFVSTFQLARLARREKADVLAGCLSQIAWVGWFKRIPSFFFAEDDLHYTKLQGYITYPFVKYIVSPECVNVGRFAGKKIAYPGYHKLAYLHPSRFKPDRTLVNISENVRFFILRFANLRAYHDVNATGITNDIAERLVAKLTPYGKVLISSERALPESLEPYRFNGKIRDMHHYMAFAELFIGDSQSMAVESALMGTPGIRFNKFVGRISVLEELESGYGLTFGVPVTEEDKLFAKVDLLLNDPEMKEQISRGRQRLLDDKIDVSGFFSWLLATPKSNIALKSNPDLRQRFR